MARVDRKFQEFYGEVGPVPPPTHLIIADTKAFWDSRRENKLERVSITASNECQMNIKPRN